MQSIGMCQLKALQVTKEIAIQGFTACQGWLYKFSEQNFWVLNKYCTKAF